MLKPFLFVAVVAGLLGACSTTNELVRRDTVANACSDIGDLFAEGIEYRLAGLAAPTIARLLSARGNVDEVTAAQITTQVIAQPLSALKGPAGAFVENAAETMAEACVTASTTEATLVNAVQ